MIPRTVIDYGFYEEDCTPDPVAYPVYETWVAMSQSRRLAVHVSRAPAFDSSGVPDLCDTGPGRIRYAIGSVQSNNWRSGYVPPLGDIHPGIAGIVDPCVSALRSDADDFCIVAQSLNIIFVCRYITPSSPGVPYFTEWDTIDSPGPVDKPWIVRGEDDELYLTYLRNIESSDLPSRIGRSIDGGENWEIQEIVAPPPEDPEGTPIGIASKFCMQPHVVGTGPLYVARNRTNTLYDFLIATDVNGPQGQNDGVTLDFLRDTQGVAIELEVNLPAGAQLNKAFSEIVQWSGTVELKEKRIPWILADPTDPDRLYVVYEDAATSSGAGAEDLNVYICAITKAGSAWSIGTRIQVDQGNVSDACGALPAAWLPSATIDSFGRVHVLFYSNRVADDACLSMSCEPSEGCCGIATHGPIYDAWYALSIHDSQTGEITGFANKSLRTSCAEHPALDSTILAAAGFPYTQWVPREYNGIALDETDPYETLVLMTYSGLLDDDDDSIDPSAIYASLVKVENPQE